MNTGLVDISSKAVHSRRARASGRITLHSETVAKVRAGTAAKGDVLATARVAAVLAVKETPRRIPLCHPVPIERVDVEFTPDDDGIKVAVTVKSIGKTGVEMEALAGVSSALLCIWDMTKMYEKDEHGQYPATAITGIRVERKEKSEPIE